MFGALRHLFLSLILGAALLAIPARTNAAVSYGTGTYTNLCGTGPNATANACNRGCNTATGTCTSAETRVTRFTCNGRLTECRSNEAPFATSYGVSGVACNQTVQVDVYDKNCRPNGTWLCKPADLVDYMVWYSGPCTSTTPTPTVPATQTPTVTPTVTVPFTPTATPTPASASSCDELQIVSGNNAFLPAAVGFRVKATDSAGPVQMYRMYFGDGQQEERSTPDFSHRYDVSGTFTARAEIRDATGTWKLMKSCEAQVTVKSLPIEPWRAECANVFITEGNNTQAPATVKFTVSGFDTKGAIRTYRMDFGNGETADNTTGIFEKRYDKAGTYVVHGYVYDTKDNWRTNENSCRQTVIVTTAPITSQPDTGVPTAYAVTALSSGLAGVVLLRMRNRLR